MKKDEAAKRSRDQTEKKKNCKCTNVTNRRSRPGVRPVNPILHTEGEASHALLLTMHLWENVATISAHIDF